MSIVVNKTKVAVKEEVTEGTWLGPASGSDFLATNESEIKPMQELLERGARLGGLGKVSNVTGMRSVEASLSTEFKAHGTAGSAPQWSSLAKGGLGGVKTVSTVTTTKASGNTTSTLEIEDADISKFAVGDIICIKESGNTWVTPITEVDDSTCAANITVLVAKGSAFSNSVVIEKFTNWKCEDSGHPSLSLVEYYEDSWRKTASGLRVTSVSIESWETGQIPMIKFSLDGIDFTESLTAPSYTPVYDSSIPSAIKSSKCFVGTTEVDILSCSWELSNEVAFKTPTKSESGRDSGRITGRSVTGSIQLFQDETDLSPYTAFRNGTEFSLFGWSGVPTGTAGEYKDIVAWYLPKCKYSEKAVGDSDGMRLHEMSFNASTGNGTSKELTIASI